MSHYNITKPHGLSNIELLRIINMFFVLIIHADFGALDIPTKKELLLSPPIALFAHSLKRSQSLLFSLPYIMSTTCQVCLTQ